MKVFLSYAREELGLADHIAAALRLEGYTVFFDRDTIATGEAFNQRIRNEIRNAACFLFLISPSSVAPHSYARTELEIAEAEWPSPKGRIIPVMAVPTSWDAVPGVLRALNAIEAGDSVVARVTLALDNLRRARRKVGLRFAVGGLVASIGVVFAGQKLLASLRDDSQSLGGAGGPVPTATVSSLSDGRPAPGAERSGSAGTSGANTAEAGVVTAGASAPIPASTPSGENSGSTGTPVAAVAGTGHDDGAWRLGPNATLKMVRIISPDPTGASADFWVGRTEVTLAEWHAVVGKGPGVCGEYCDPKHPVRVSGKDAIAFTNALSKRVGLTQCYRDVGSKSDWLRDCTGFRLPTEEEWQIAADIAKATKDLSSVDPFGFRKPPSIEAYFCDKGNHGPMDGCQDAFPGLAKAGEGYPANRWGLYDIFGNVTEYVWDNAKSDHRRRGGSYRSLPDLRISVDPDGRRRVSVNQAFHLIPLGPGGFEGMGLRVARSARDAR